MKKVVMKTIDVIKTDSHIVMLQREHNSYYGAPRYRCFVSRNASNTFGKSFCIECWGNTQQTSELAIKVYERFVEKELPWV